jgi:thiosulfate/3-mercaptopyruvate sulfurtransferase
MYGHKNVRVLDGGLENWKASGYDISTKSSVPTLAVYPSTELVVNPNAVAVLDEVKAALAQGKPVIDCRDQKQYDTKHIPGAILIPEADMYDADGTVKDKNELKSYFAAKGLTEETSIITYCNTGTTATVQYLILTEILGYKNVQNYDSSLTEWNALSIPVEQPKPQKELPITGGNPLAMVVIGFLMTGLGVATRKRR